MQTMDKLINLQIFGKEESKRLRVVKGMLAMKQRVIAASAACGRKQIPRIVTQSALDLLFHY
jgi:hypothetical protein